MNSIEWRTLSRVRSQKLNAYFKRMLCFVAMQVARILEEYMYVTLLSLMGSSGVKRTGCRKFAGAIVL